MYPFIPHSLQTAVENNSTEDLGTDTNEYTLPLWEKTDRLTTAPWYIYIQFVEIKAGNTLK